MGRHKLLNQPESDREPKRKSIESTASSTRVDLKNGRLTPAAILSMQTQYGNAYVTKLIQRTRGIRSDAGLSHPSTPPTLVQSDLSVGGLSASVIQRNGGAPTIQVAMGTWGLGSVAQGTTTIKSTGFASCVGLVLYNSYKQVGLIAHFMSHQNVRSMINEFIDRLDGMSGHWEATVFRGKPPDVRDSPIMIQQSRDKANMQVAEIIDNMNRLQITRIVEKPQHYQEVSLDLQTGTVTFPASQTTSSRPTHKRVGSSG